VLGGTGPVGQRAARILAQLGATVRLASRSTARAEQACEAIRAAVPGAKLEPVATADAELLAALEGSQLLLAAGAAGVQFLAEPQWRGVASLKVAIDLNAVPPLGLGGIGVTDKAVQKDQVAVYGAIGVGGLKMKIHKAAVQQLFQANDQILDTDEVYRLATLLG
jgi:NAD(P)-dependent dehydrogenase (short-subunit alcohol dehydrogenase family)